MTPSSTLQSLSWADQTILVVNHSTHKEKCVDFLYCCTHLALCTTPENKIYFKNIIRNTKF